MAARLNVSEAERLSFSHRRLQAISALRNAGLDPVGVMQGKEQRPNHRGRWYRLVLPDGTAVYLPTLRQVVSYADDYRLYTTTMFVLEIDERISWQRWLADGTAYALALLVPQLRDAARQSPQEPSRPAPAQLQPSAPARCSWLECPYPATG